MKNCFWKAVPAALGMLALILDGQTALQGAATGMELCLKTVIPSLFPFLFLCAMLTGSLWGTSMPVLAPLMRKLGIPQGADSLLVAALLGGYPAGAKAIGDGFRENRLDRKTAEHLLMFCSNAGPAFLFGITAAQFPRLSWAWGLWAVQIGSSLLTGFLTAGPEPEAASLPHAPENLSRTLERTTKVMAILCGWILLFQILLAFGNRWLFWMLPEDARVLVTGLLELSSGCCALARVENLSLRFLWASVMLSFGGLCVVMQTAAVIGKLPLGRYLRGKLIQTGLSAALAILYLLGGWPGFLPVLVIFIPARKKRGGFLPAAGV